MSATTQVHSKSRRRRHAVVLDVPSTKPEPQYQCHRYTPLKGLDSIRLLILHPGVPGSMIRCTLTHTTIAECFTDIYDHYTALSYVWGDSKSTETIFVDGHPFEATSNLSAALRDIRDVRQPLRMWIDAICIDQGNLEERSTQVGLMKEIYSIAQRTIVHIGEDLTPSLVEVITRSSAFTQGHAPRERMLDIAAQILSRPWFTRVWVYQELVLSREVWVQTGCLRVPWDLLYDVVFCAVTFQCRFNWVYNSPPSAHLQGTAGNLPFHRISSMQETRQKFHMSLIDRSQPQSLAKVLSTRRGFGVSDLRDLVYGHLAVAGIGNSKSEYAGLADPPVVDYTKSVIDVFTEAASFCYYSSEDCRVLFDVEVFEPYQRMKGLPSWVADWSLPSSSVLSPLESSHQKFLGENFRFSELFPLERPVVRYIQNRPILVLQTVFLGTLESLLSDVLPSAYQMWKFEQAVYQSVLSDFSNAHYNASGVPWNAASGRLQKTCVARAIYSAWEKKLGSGFMPPLTKLCFEQSRQPLINYDFSNLMEKFMLRYSLSTKDFSFTEDLLLNYFLKPLRLGLEPGKALPGRRIAAWSVKANTISHNLRGWAIVPRATALDDSIYMCWRKTVEGHEPYGVMVHSQTGTELPNFHPDDIQNPVIKIQTRYAMSAKHADSLTRPRQNVIVGEFVGICFIYLTDSKTTRRKEASSWYSDGEVELLVLH